MTYEMEVFATRNTCVREALIARDVEHARERARNRSTNRDIHHVVLYVGGIHAELPRSRDWIEYQDGGCVSATMFNALDV